VKSVMLPVLCKIFLRRALLCDDSMRSTAQVDVNCRRRIVLDGHAGATTMLDTDATVTTGLRPSTFGRLPTGFGDPDPTDLDRLAASLDYLALRYCKPAMDESSQQPAAEAMAEDEQFLIGAVAAAGEQL
jgi:hypothetical protein